MIDINKLQTIPSSPGVYLFKDSLGQIIYVGKAKKLKSRIKSYFKKEGDSRPTVRYFLPKIVKVMYVVTGSDKEALLLENNLIKKFKPKYNILLRDDKTFRSIVISKHDFPRMFFVRKTNKGEERGHISKGCVPFLHLLFGPYVSTDELKRAFSFIRKNFKIRTCKDVDFSKKKRPCLDFEVSLCSAPCAQKISKEEYDKNVRNAVSYLKGNYKSLLKDLASQMKVCAKKYDFEKAKNLRDQIFATKRTLEGKRVNLINIEELNKEVILKGKIEDVAWDFGRALKAAFNLGREPKTIECFDMSHLSGNFAVGAKIRYENGEFNKNLYRRYKIRQAYTSDDYAMMYEVLMRRIKSGTIDKDLPDLILIDGGLGQLSVAQKVLFNFDIADIEIIAIAKAKENKAVDTFYIPNRKNPIILKKGSYLLREL